MNIVNRNEKKVVLIFGGTSSERLVSVASAQNIVNFLNEPEIYYIDNKGRWITTTKAELLAHQNPFTMEYKPSGSLAGESLSAMKFNLAGKIVFIALHGTEGEDGGYQQFFEQQGIYFTGSGSTSSALCFDKEKAKEEAQKFNIPLAKELSIDFSQPSAEEKVMKFFNENKKIVLKPVANGSSFGLFIVSTKDQLEKALLAIKSVPEKRYLCESFIKGRELTIGVYQSQSDLRVLCPSEVILDSGANFDYEGKYLGKGSTEITPADLNPFQKKQCQDLALKAHEIFNCYGYSRTDMILTESGPVFLETNTLPGMTKASFFPQQLAAENLSFQQFVDDQITMALNRLKDPVESRK